MTYSESKFRNYIKKQLGADIYLKKIGDKKQGVTSNIGMPDYLCIDQGVHIWFEVKESRTKTTFNLNDISESQYIEFDKMLNAGALIYMAIYVNGELYIVPYESVRAAKFLTNDISLSIDTLSSWRVKW